MEAQTLIMTTNFVFLTMYLCSLYCGVVETSDSTGVFSSEPKDVCAVNGQNVFFPCEYNNTAESFYSVSWRINERTWSASRLPPNHRQNATGLVVRIDTSNNQSNYSCIIRISVQSEVMEFESNRAVLTVVAPDNMSNIACPTLKPTMVTLFITTSSSGTSINYSERSESLVVPTVSVSSILRSTKLNIGNSIALFLGHCTACNNDELGLECPGIEIISISVMSTVAACLLVTVTVVTAIVLFKHISSKHEPNEQNEPVYEEINGLGQVVDSVNPTAIYNMEINCSYGDIKRIKMTDSPAYGHIENYSHQ